jgi:hypothetical protein
MDEIDINIKALPNPVMVEIAEARKAELKKIIAETSI